jgi:DNA repair exonuclease SbcCD ATPase subunit
MKLSRIRIEQFRQFDKPLLIDGLQAGLNLFCGPNESGKSTIVAAIRAAFFERYRSSSAEEFRPRNGSNASPSVEIEFTHHDTAYRLSKSFLARKRCELQAGAQNYDGVDAEDHLAELLGFRLPGRGASHEEHWGVPGLLWIEQGSAHEVHLGVKHATDHLRNALNASVGEVASTGGDELIAKVENLRNALLTPASGKPRGDYASAIEREQSLAERIRACQKEVSEYRQRVDQLANLRASHLRDEAHKPWLALREQQRAASERLTAVRGVAEKLQHERRRAEEIDGTRKLLREQLENYAQQEAMLASRSAALTSAENALLQASEIFEQCNARRAEADLLHRNARENLRRARLEETRRNHEQQLESITTTSQTVAATITKAEIELRALEDLQRVAASTEIKSVDLQTLRTQYAKLRELTIQQESAATHLRFRLTKESHLRLGDEPLLGDGERHVFEATTLQIPGIGEIDIVPGGNDLAALQRKRLHLQDEHSALLQRMGVASLDAAEQRHQQYARALTDKQRSEATLRALAPNGIDALRQTLSAQQAKASEIKNALLELPAADPDGQTMVAVAVAEREEESTRSALEQIDRQLHQSQLAVREQQSAVESAQRELARIREVLEASDRATRLSELQHSLIDANAEHAQLTTRIEALNKELSDARPDILEQDLQRFRISAEQLEKQHADRNDAIRALEVELQVIGARGLDELLAELSRDHLHAHRRLEELRRRANALDLLLRLLRDKRNALTRRLQAPLQKHLDHYLQLLFPQARLEISEDLSPGTLMRNITNGIAGDISPYETLSFGAREQMGIVSRLAYADLLREAGKPTLLILDDALVHSDTQRLAQMKRLLFDAATRHQILLFTCQPEQWQDMGVAARDIASLR